MDNRTIKEKAGLIKEQKIFQRLADMVAVTTAHKEGQKYVFLKSEENITALTQFAYGKFLPGEGAEEHVHPTMEECFFFLKGEGWYKVNGEKYPLAPGTFVRIPPGVPHSLEAGGNETLEFVYFGVAV